MAQIDTICALASGPVPSAIAVIRVSGPHVSALLESLISGPQLEAHQATLRTLRDRAGASIDEGLVLWMPAPRSYTGEDTAEFYLHGGQAVVSHMLEALTAFEGVRVAEPGEFTRRAYETGKLDLTQAEGIADLIEAETRAQKSQAIRQSRGALGDIYQTWRTQLLACLSLIEVAIDFPDEGDTPESTDDPVYQQLIDLISSFDEALHDGHIGEKIRDGFTVAIIGEPNVGKSSLLNRLAQEDAAIVTDIPGTTRDIVKVRQIISGQVVWLTDTAGLRTATDQVEREGIKRARIMAEEADLRLHVRDASQPYPVPRETQCLLQDGDIEIWNKSDLGAGSTVMPKHTVSLSAETGEGIEELRRRLALWVEEKVEAIETPAITRARHRVALASGLDNLIRAQDGLVAGIGAELVAEDVRLAIRALGSVIGDIGVEDVLGAVFSEFCIGK